MTILVAILIGAVVGLLLGFLGGGGAIMVVPALVYIMQTDAHAAKGVALIIVGINAAIGGILALRDKRADGMTAAVFGSAGMVTAYLGAVVAKDIPDNYLLIAFSVLLLVIAFFMYRGTTKTAPATTTPQQRPLWQVAAVGSLVGLVTGILGVGGGFIIVPALVLLVSLPMRTAVGTSLLIITMNSAASLLGLRDSSFDWQLVAALLGGAIPAMLVANRYGGLVDQTKLRRGFAVFVTLVAVFMLVDNALH